MKSSLAALAALAAAVPVHGQVTSEPFPTPIRATEGVIRVDYREFAALPDIAGEPARMMLLSAEPGGQRLFVNDMRGPLYTLQPNGSARLYLDINEGRWGHAVQSTSRERGFQSFALHPQFNEAGAPGYGKLYTWSDVSDTSPPADFVPGGDGDTHDTVLLEWTARNPTSRTYDGGPPREVLRVQQPFGNHNGGQIAFNPGARPGQPDFGMLYIGNADGGSGGDPMNLSQNPASSFGKILRIDPLGRDAANGKYGIPKDNPFVGRSGWLGEIWALGVRNPQRFGWDPATGMLFVADIGQNMVEELSPVPRGGNLGWNVWEGSFQYVSRQAVDASRLRGDPTMTYPTAEYDHADPILTGRAAVTGVVVVRGPAFPQLDGRILFGDNPSGEVFHVPADRLPEGGQAAIGRVLLNEGSQATTLLDLIRRKNVAQGRQPAARADLRFGTGGPGQIFLLNKQDGTVRLLVPPGR